MKKVKLIVAYDGTEYCGWQLQPNGVSVESVLNAAISDLTGEDIKVVGASRTDAGVHAKGNVAVFETNARMPGEKMSYALNQRLPEDVVIQDSCEVDMDFHPRHCKSSKTYEYKILNRTFNDPTLRRYCYFYYMKLDIERMRKGAGYLVGEHDFTSFAAPKTQVKDFVRTIYAIDIDTANDVITVRISGNGFLYNMVRIIVGTLLEVGRGQMEPEDVKRILEAKDRKKAGPTAPPEGLTLIRIDY